MVTRNDADLSGSSFESFEFRARKAVSSMNMISIWYSSNECPSKNEQLRARFQPVMNSSMSDETRNLISLEFMMNLYTISMSKKHQPPWCRGSSNHSGCHVQNALATSDIWRPKRFPGSVLEERDIHFCFHCFCLFSQWDGKSWTLRPLREIIPASSPLSLWDPGSNFYPALYRAIAHSCIHQILQLLYTFWSWEEISWTICFQRQHTKCLHSLVGAPWTKQRDMANFPKSSKACCTSFCSLTKISASNGYANIQDIHENLDVNFPHQFAAVHFMVLGHHHCFLALDREPKWQWTRINLEPKMATEHWPPGRGQAEELQLLRQRRVHLLRSEDHKGRVAFCTEEHMD